MKTSQLLYNKVASWFMTHHLEKRIASPEQWFMEPSMYKKLIVILFMLIFSLSACSIFSFNNVNPVTTVTETEILGIATESVAPTLIIETATPLPTDTPTRSVPTFTPTMTVIPTTAVPVKTANPYLLYVLQAGSPRVLPNFSHPELQCNWMGVGGQVFGADSQPVTSLIVQVGGTLGEKAFNALAVTGLAPNWGPGGFEITLADKPTASNNTLWLQVFDTKGDPISDKVYFPTYEDCAQSAIMVNLTKISAANLKNTYLPLTSQNAGAATATPAP